MLTLATIGLAATYTLLVVRCYYVFSKVKKATHPSEYNAIDGVFFSAIWPFTALLTGMAAIFSGDVGIYSNRSNPFSQENRHSE